MRLLGSTHRFYWFSLSRAIWKVLDSHRKLTRSSLAIHAKYYDVLARTLHITNTKYIRNSRKISTFTNTKEWEVQCHQWALVQSQKTCSQSHETLFLTVHRYQLTPCVRVLFFSLSQSVSLNDDVDDEPLMTILLLLLLKQGNVKVFFDLKMSNDRLVSPRFCSS